ncbi:MAG: hypothetical protein IJB30_07695 [Clostridia bacterium]|nr:hypothetical protein [Clostridia bacterium]
MKKNIIIAMTAIFALLLCACSAKEEGFSEKDLGLEIAGETYFLRTDSAPLIEALGEGYEYSEMVSCVYDGQDKTFAYPGLTVNTVPVEGKDIIEMLTLTDGTYATLRGCRVGDSREAVISAYGEEYFDDGYINYTLTNDPADIQAERIQFEMSGDTVSAIYIYSPSY